MVLSVKLSNETMSLEKKIKTKNATVAIVGLGYVGLPLAIEFSRAGFPVYGIDVTEEKIQSLKRGQSYVEDVDSETVARQVGSKRFIPTRDFRVLRDADAIIICVPTPLRKPQAPDVS